MSSKVGVFIVPFINFDLSLGMNSWFSSSDKVIISGPKDLNDFSIKGKSSREFIS
jgi:hypothetical protein